MLGSGVLILPGAAFATILVLRTWRSDPARGRAALVLELVLLTYVVALVGLTLFPIPIDPNARAAARELGAPVGIQSTPFATISMAMRLGIDHAQGRVLIGNLVAFVPLGLLLPFVTSHVRSVARVVGIGALTTVAIESAQLVISAIVGYDYRSADVDDVIVNVCGVMVGYAAYRVLARLILRALAATSPR